MTRGTIGRSSRRRKRNDQNPKHDQRPNQLPSTKLLIIVKEAITTLAHNHIRRTICSILRTHKDIMLRTMPTNHTKATQLANTKQHIQDTVNIRLN